MPVTIKKKALTLITLVKSLYKVGEGGVDGLYDKAVQLEAGGCTLRTYPNRLQIVINGKTILATYTELKFETLNLAMKGKLGFKAKNSVKDKVAWLIVNAYTKYLDNNLVVKMSPDGKPKTFNIDEEVAAAKKEQDGIKLEKKVVTDEVDLKYSIGIDLAEEKDWSDLVLYPGDLMEDKVVSLTQATKLHQPTAGTDCESRYHVIALGESVIVAARIKENNAVSIRAELREHPNTKGSQKAKTALLAAGLDHKKPGHYSLHLDPTDQLLAIKSVGAILHSINIPFRAVTGNLQAIVRVGK